METTIKNRVDQFFKETKLDKIQEIEQKLITKFGQNFIDKHVKQITLKKNSVIIKTNTIEAKTEINLFKKEIETTKTKIIIL